MRVRQHIDGSYWIPRHHKFLEAKLDAELIRVPGQLRWFPRTVNLTFEPFMDKYKGRHAYIIGKGPSLDMITSAHFDKNCPVLCINDSIRKIDTLNLTNPLFIVQQDANLRESCRPQTPGAHLILCKKTGHWYPDFKNKIIIEPQALALQYAGATVLVGMRIAQMMGCTDLRMIAFDALLSGNCDYAKSIGYPSTRGGEPTRFLKQRAKVHALADALKVKLTFVKVFDTIPQSQCSPQERDGIVLEELSVPTRCPSSLLSQIEQPLSDNLIGHLESSLQHKYRGNGSQKTEQNSEDPTTTS